MGLTILKAAFASVAETASEEAKYAQKISEALVDNYLCNISVQEFHEHCENLLPQHIQGKEFLERYGEIVDTATQGSTRKNISCEEPRRTHDL